MAPWDDGTDGIQTMFSHHTCNAICKAFGVSGKEFKPKPSRDERVYTRQDNGVRHFPHVTPSRRFTAKSTT